MAIRWGRGENAAEAAQHSGEGGATGLDAAPGRCFGINGYLLTDLLPSTDEAWADRYPPHLAAAAEFHFAPLEIAHAASDWLAEGARAAGKPIVDLGAGAGKFCLAAAARHSDVEWVGAEIRPALVAEARRLQAGFGLLNCRFAEADITSSDLTPYAGAFLFNPFYEQLDASADELGDGLPRGRDAYRRACAALRQNLALLGGRFRLATYYCHGPEVPTGWGQVWVPALDRLAGWTRAERD